MFELKHLMFYLLKKIMTNEVTLGNILPNFLESMCVYIDFFNILLMKADKGHQLI